MCKKVLNSGEKHFLSAQCALMFPPNYFLVSNSFYTKWSEEQLPRLYCEIMKLISRYKLQTEVLVLVLIQCVETLWLGLPMKTGGRRSIEMFFLLSMEPVLKKGKFGYKSVLTGTILFQRTIEKACFSEVAVQGEMCL